MYKYIWDEETGGLLLTTTHQLMSNEPRPVYYKELDILGLDKVWKYKKDDSYPYMWAEANKYWYRGKLVAKTVGGNIYEAPKIELKEEPEENGGELKFVDINTMVKKNHEIMENLVRDTIKNVYNIYIEFLDKVDVFYVAFSGGKDSIVALDIIKRAIPNSNFKVIFGDTGMEFSDTYQLVETIKTECEANNIEFFISKSNISPVETWKKFGPPGQRMRWCCSVHKTAPQILLLRNITKNPQFKGMAFTGIRADESASRSEYDSVGMGNKHKGQYSCHPILKWNSAELFLYIYQHNLLLNDAYKKGNSRAGCLVCPLATNKNMFFKQVSYGTENGDHPSTNTFNQIILDTSSKDFTNNDAVKEFMTIGGWKARRSGRELSFGINRCNDSYKNNVFIIEVNHLNVDWKEWIKTVGKFLYVDESTIEIEFDKEIYKVKIIEENNKVTLECIINNTTKSSMNFMSALKIAMKKSAYCEECKVCEANCPFGYISMENGSVKIDNRCIKCRKCHDIPFGCLVANSMRVPKGDKKMGTIDRYSNFGCEYIWLEKYYKLKNEFWNSSHGLGNNMIKSLKRFLNDANIIEKNNITSFGNKISEIGIDKEEAWGLIVTNLAYTSEFNWWINNIEINKTYIPEKIIDMLGDDMSSNSKKHIVSAYKNIFISNKILSEKLQLGIPTYEIKNGNRKLIEITRGKWQSPDSRVILYSLYKFAENCDNYYQFSLSQLLNPDIDRQGISPTEIFGLDREQMENILNGLTINYPDFINASFTLDLDNITLRENKTSDDVLSLF